MSKQTDLINIPDAITVDGSNNVGIGTDSPTGQLHIKGDADMGIRVESAAGGYSAIGFGDSVDTVRGGITYYSTDNSLQFRGYNNTERMRIDSSGNLLVGQSSFNTGVAGGGITNYGFNYGTVDGGLVARFTRLTSDGDIVQFRKDGATVGSIGVNSGDQVYFAASDGMGIKVDTDNTSVEASNAAGADNDNAVNLGSSGTRWKDAYLSGGIHLGGTGAANKLDDYEYGVWNPGNYNIVLASTNGNYVKVGRMCTVAFRIVWPTNSNTAQAKISLPFACVSHGSTAHMAGLAVAFTTYTNTPTGGVYSGGTFMEFFKIGGNNLTNADLSGKQINGSVTYITNS